MDPLLIYTSVAILAGILLLGALEKLRHFLLFEGAVSAYKLLPYSLVKPFAVLFVAMECVSALLLLIPDTRVAGAYGALIVLAVSIAGLAINLLRGRTDMDCGCGGLAEKSGGISWWLVTRNLVLMALTTPALLVAYSGQRSLGWLDGFTFLVSTLAALGVYFSVNQLIDSHTRLQKI